MATMIAEPQATNGGPGVGAVERGGLLKDWVGRRAEAARDLSVAATNGGLRWGAKQAARTRP